MKKYSILICALSATSFLPLSVEGQKPVVVSEKNLTFTHGQYPGLELNIPEVDKNSVEQEFIKRIEKKTKSKVSAENGELTLFGALIEEISEAPINIFSKVTPADSSVLIEITVELLPKEYASSTQNSTEYNLVRKYLFEFGREQYGSLAKEQLKTEEKTLKTLEDKYAELNNEKTKLEKSIVEEKNSIVEKENGIVSLKNEMNTLNEQLSAERAALTMLSDETAKEQKEAQVKDIEKGIKKAMDQTNSNEKSIIESKSAITSAELDINTNTKAQETVRYQIEEQKPRVLAAELKYNNIINSILK